MLVLWILLEKSLNDLREVSVVIDCFDNTSTFWASDIGSEKLDDACSCEDY
jgi:hypothetical protein